MTTVISNICDYHVTNKETINSNEIVKDDNNKTDKSNESIKSNESNFDIDNLLTKMKPFVYKIKNMEKLNLNYLIDIENDFNIFTKWMSVNINKSNLHEEFMKKFSGEYRMTLFANFSKYFDQESVVKDDALFYWKYLIVDLMKNHKKHKSIVNNIKIDLENKTINLKLIKQKQIFECLLFDDHVCYLKENGNFYYLS